MKFKKLLAVALSLVVLFGVLLLGTLTAKADTSGYYTYTVTNGEATITACDTSVSGAVSIPSTLSGCPVTSIGDGAFYDCDSVSSVFIPSSIKSIGEAAFAHCDKLENVAITSGVTSISYDSFWLCRSLRAIIVSDNNAVYSSLDGVLFNKNKTSLICYPAGKLDTSYCVPNNVTNIDSFAFFSCSSLTSITIPDSVTSIGSATFYDCSSLTSIAIPDGVAFIDDYVFSGCSSLTSIIIPDSVTSIGGSAFSDCSSLTTITIPDSVTSIGGSAFSDCRSLEKITLPFVGANFGGTSNTHFGYIFGASSYSKNSSYVPQSLKEVIITKATSISSNAFYNCSSLTSITIPDSVTSIGGSAFSDCRSLEKITLPFVGANFGGTSNTHFGYIFGASSYSKNSSYVPQSLKEVIITKATSISSNAFYNCSSLTSITIPDSVTSIGSGAFSGCSSLKKITLPFVGARLNGSSYTYKHFGYIFGASSYSKNGNYVPQSLKEVIITKATSIGDYAFYDCTSLTSITIPNSVTIIGKSVFAACSSLTSITIPDSVTSIGSSAFSSCSSLTSIAIPYGVAIIDNYVFAGCSSITSIIIPDSVTSIGGSAFSDCNSLTSITIPDSVTNIGYSAFSGCSSITSIIIPDSVTSIGGSAFSDCNSLTSITIPDSVTSIGSGAFAGCSSLTSIIIPDSVTCIGSSAFSGCSSLEKITLPFVSANFGGTSNTHFGYIFGASSYSKNSSYVPQSLKEVIITKATSIGDYEFYDCTSLTSITIPNSVTIIGKSVFAACSSLTSITIPDSVTSIGSSAFSSCSSLTSIAIPYGVAIIDNYVFAGCSSLTSIIIPDSVTSIGGSAFSDCNSLTSITIPDSVTNIGYSAFSGCSSLENTFIGECLTDVYNIDFSSLPSLKNILVSENNVTYCSLDGVLFNKDKSNLIYYPGGRTDLSYMLPESVIMIEEKAFKDAISLKAITVNENNSTYYSKDGVLFDNKSTLIRYPAGKIDTLYVIPDSVGFINEYAFAKCFFLTNIIIPDKTVLIGHGAFADCTSFTNINIPNSITIIGNSAFAGCSSLTSITIPDSVTSIGSGAFAGCSSLTSITIPDSVTSIDSGAFSGCSSLTTITIPNSITCIGQRAFYGCTSLESIILPNSVTSIDHEAFISCTSLMRITIPENVTWIGMDVFSGCESLTDIYYCGTEQQWNEINISYSNIVLASANIKYGHIFGDWEIKINPTCEGTGEKYRVCICGYEETETISFLGHDYSNEFTIDKEQTDFEEGSKSKHCSRCDSVTDVTAIPKTSIANGSCGEGTLWAVRENGTLIISGSGATKNYGTYASVPWYNYSNMITTIGISEEITYIGHYSFRSLVNLETIKCGNPDITFSKYYMFGVTDMVFYGKGGGALEDYTDANGYNLIKPENPETPDVPELLAYNANSVTLVPIDGYEYSRDGLNWQASNVFENLQPFTEYSFWQRIADNVYKTSVASKVFSIITAPLPTSPTIDTIVGNTVKIHPMQTYEYSIDGIVWKNTDIFENLEYNKIYCIYSRYIPYDLMPEPTVSAPTKVIILSSPEVQLIGATKIVVKCRENHEYSIDGVIWQSSNVFTNLVPEFEYTVWQRYTDNSVYSIQSEGTSFITNGQDEVDTTPDSSNLVTLRKALLNNSNDMSLDYNADGEVNIIDLVRLKKFLVGMDVPLGPENTETAELIYETAYLDTKNTFA